MPFQTFTAFRTKESFKPSYFLSHKRLERITQAFLRYPEKKKEIRNEGETSFRILQHPGSISEQWYFLFFELPVSSICFLLAFYQPKQRFGSSFQFPPFQIQRHKYKPPVLDYALRARLQVDGKHSLRCRVNRTLQSCGGTHSLRPPLMFLTEHTHKQRAKSEMIMPLQV